MQRSIGVILITGLMLGTAALSGCGEKVGESTTNLVEMNASDGSMNDMTVVESATLDQAGGAMVDNAAEPENGSEASNAN